MRIALPAIVLACAALAADISGFWNFQVKLPSPPLFVFKQEVEKLSGAYHGLSGKAPLSGTVKGDQVEFTFDSPRLGMAHYMAHYKGTKVSPACLGKFSTAIR